MQNRESARKKILVIDDDPDIIEFLHDFLILEGYTVAATTRTEHLEELRNRDLPDLILLDVFLSGKDGRDIVVLLKNQENTKHIPVIMLSAHPSVGATVRAAGANDFLEKPFDLDVLLTKLQMFLS